MVSKRVAIFLAGGTSERMGQDKPTLQLNGESLIQRHLSMSKLINLQRVYIVVNAFNGSQIKAMTTDDPRVEILEQSYPRATGAVRTGLDACPDAEELFIVCVNDIVRRDIYSVLRNSKSPIAIPTVRSQYPFLGGMLEISNENKIQSIIERPQGGVPAGSFINILIHRLSGLESIDTLRDQLSKEIGYEEAINGCIRSGYFAEPIFLKSWVGIKTSIDLQIALEHLDEINRDLPIV